MLMENEDTQTECLNVSFLFPLPLSPSNSCLQYYLLFQEDILDKEKPLKHEGKETCGGMTSSKVDIREHKVPYAVWVA